MASIMKIVTLAAVAACMASASAAQENARQIPLPAEIQYPEGVAVSPVDGQIYVNAATTGLLARINPTDGNGTVIASPLDPAHATTEGVKALGLKVDQQNRVWVAGGATGTGYVVDTDSGEVLARFSTPAGTTLINDVAVTDSGAYFTDTRRPVLWRASTRDVRDGALEPWIDLRNSPIPYGDGANLNGIAATADDRYLIVIHMSRGELFRIDTASKAITPIRVSGGPLDGGDGVLVSGQRLYVVRQPHQEIVSLQLSADLSEATVQKRITPPELTWPATAALTSQGLVIGNSQLNKRASDTPERPFTVAIVPLSLLD